MERATVRVLEAGTYLLPNNRAGEYAEEGDIIEVRGGVYADSLVAEGYLMYWDESMGATPYVAPEPPPNNDIVATVSPPSVEELATASRRKRRGQ